jgi:hypothetical protein
MNKLKLIGSELKNHSPFTLLGAATGIVFMLAGQKWFAEQAETLFTIFHPLHVVLSAMVTASLFEIHRKAKNFFVILIIGVVGAMGVATLSDCILPFFGETILGVAVPTHAGTHHHAEDAAPTTIEIEDEHEHTDECEHGHEDHADEPEHNIHSEACAHEHEGCGHPRWHIGFIEEWYLVFPAAIIGVLLAYFKPSTHLPHASHVLISTWASSAHMLMNTHADMTLTLLLGMFVVLFLAVWLPCCVSDIIFPLLFVGPDGKHEPHACVFCRKKDSHDGK